MSFEKRWVVVCDVCSCTQPEMWAATKREAAKLATAAGWRRYKGKLRCMGCERYTPTSTEGVHRLHPHPGRRPVRVQRPVPSRASVRVDHGYLRDARRREYDRRRVRPNEQGAHTMTTSNTAITDPAVHVYYAHKRERNGRVMYINATLNRPWLDYFGSADPVVTVRLRECTTGDLPSSYWGWIDAKKPDRYTMVWPTRLHFSICFQCGPESAESVGHGRAVNLHIEEITT